MPKRTGKEKRPTDVNQLARFLVDQSTREQSAGTSNVVQMVPAERKKNPAAVALGRLGGKKGGRVRAERLTPEQRSQSASKAARTRWAKQY